MTMNRYRNALLLASVVFVFALQPCCRRGADDNTDDLSPLIIDKDAPLLLDEPELSATTGNTAAAVENAACFVCHANYTEEPLVSIHARKDVGCTKCHGKSYLHRNDENHQTPPDRMFGADTVVALCTECHHAHEISDEKLESMRKKRTDKPASAPAVCTDCHGKHRLTTRTVRWNKSTGERL
ncbi:MAG: cytochrome c3 family protein [Sedimentisphaerales bacterium]|nr:cytochrome c3 family protein [Sedimentisphaerales bacterium]